WATNRAVNSNFVRIEGLERRFQRIKQYRNQMLVRVPTTRLFANRVVQSGRTNRHVSRLGLEAQVQATSFEKKCPGPQSSPGREAQLSGRKRQRIGLPFRAQSRRYVDDDDLGRGVPRTDTLSGSTAAGQAAEYCRPASMCPLRRPEGPCHLGVLRACHDVQHPFARLEVNPQTKP